MYFAKCLIVGASLVTLAVAQSQRIAFTVLPSSMTAGQDITLHWGGGDDSAVTITLQQGTTDNLKTVQLVKGDATGNNYTWTVPTNLPNADDYAFKIEQGDQPPNYTGMITLTGGSVSSSSTSASASASSTGSSNGAGVVGGGSSGSSSSNSTVTATATANATTTAMMGTAASAAGTGVSMSRNTTMSMATLSSSGSTASATASNSDVGGSGGTPTSSTSAPGSNHTGGATLLASNFALLVCAVVGVVYIG